MTQWLSSNSSVNKSQTGTLTWNANGTLRQLAISDTYNSPDNQTCLYGYDNLARLLSANCSPTWSQTFSYDAVGNIWKAGNVAFNNGYGSGNHVAGFSYDGMGNVTNDGGNTYSYDAEGRPVSVAGTQVIYDAFSRAVEYNNGSSHTQIVYDPTGGKLAYMSGQTLQTYMLPFAGGVRAVFNSVGLQYIRHADWLGSARLELDVNGNLYAARSYAPFGETYSGAGTGGTDRVFTGQTQDVIMGPTGIYDFLFRQHSSGQGRWLVPDPAGLAAVDLTNPQTWNRYAYVGNNPLSFIDPLGLSCEDPHDGQPCVVQVTDTPLDSAFTPLAAHSGGNGGGTKYRLTVAESDDIHGTGPCKGNPDCLALRRRFAGSVTKNVDVTTPGIEGLFHKPETAQVWNAASTVANPKFYAYWTAAAAVPGVIYNAGPLIAAGSDVWMDIEAAHPGATLKLMDVINVATPPPSIPTTFPGWIWFGSEIYDDYIKH